MSEIEKDFSSVREQISVKVDEAIKILEDARNIASTSKMSLKSIDTWYELKEIVEDFIDIPEGDSWDNSGCSF
jgi:hypothetical protein